MKSAESREMLEGRLLKIEVEKRKNDLNWIELIAKGLCVWEAPQHCKRVSKPTTNLCNGDEYHYRNELFKTHSTSVFKHFRISSAESKFITSLYSILNSTTALNTPYERVSLT